MSKKHCRWPAVLLLLAGLMTGQEQPAMATAVDRVALCNLEGHAGETIVAEIGLQGNEPQERSGFWSVYYKQTAGDSVQMDITTWISIEPVEYIIAEGQNITFNVSIKIPDEAAPGLWGAVSADAGLSGHSAERRTYLIFRDTITGGNVYSGLLIPVSVIVLETEGRKITSGETATAVTTEARLFPPSTNQAGPGTEPNFFKDNLLVIILGCVIIVLVVVVVMMSKNRR